MQLCRNILIVSRRFRSSSHYFSMENLLSARDVRGMKILDKELFERTIEVPCLVVKFNSLTKILKYVKPYLLKLRKLRPIRIRNESYKEILLNPNIVRTLDDFKIEDKTALSNVGEKLLLEYIDVKLNYENWSSTEIFHSILPKELGNVSGYSITGHIVQLNLKSEFLDYKNIIAQVLLDKVIQAKTVVNKFDIIGNEFRTFEFEVLAGEKDFFVEAFENRCSYKFDFSKVYWNPRLCTERARVIESINKCDYLYDVFAGVGPFAIPAAKKKCKVLANDLNSDAIAYLRENLRLNKVEKYVETSIKDASDFIKEDFKNHFIQLQPGDYKVFITMNLPSLAPTFLPFFKGLFSSEDFEKVQSLPSPLVYVYCFIKNESDPVSSAKALVSRNLDMELEDEIVSGSFVRKVSPNKDMMRVVLSLTPRILMSQKRIASPVLEPTCKKSNIDFISQSEEDLRHNEKTKEK